MFEINIQIQSRFLHTVTNQEKIPDSQVINPLKGPYQQEIIANSSIEPFNGPYIV